MSGFLSNTPEDLARSLSEGRRTIEERETQQKSARANLPYINLQNFPLSLMALGMFTEKEATQSQSVPFFKEKHEIKIGTINPGNPLLKEQIQKLSKKWKLDIYLISESSYKDVLKFYSKVVHPDDKNQEVITFSDTEKKADFQKVLDSEISSVSEKLNIIFAKAVYFDSSDIHFEPEDHLVKIRFRVDGVLQDAGKLASNAYPSVLSRIKLQSGMKLNVTNESQDGRLTVLDNGEPLDIRVSVLPSAYGEAVVMRLLGVGAVDLKIKDLGLRGRSLQIVHEQLAKPNGMILTTGPTGSGKTTTLYAFLQELNNPSVKIITLEDPIEYKIEGIQQTPIDHRVDFNFAKGLRAILRQDPDILMVGEIRDPETAEVSLQASLTGHIVLSTLHANDASGAVPRLITMGVKPYTIAPALNAIIAQRLVRRLCQNCIEPAQVPPPLLEKTRELLNDLPKESGFEIPKELIFYHSKGCDVCKGLGYKGRVGVYEVIEVNDDMRELILKDPAAVEVKRMARAHGTISMTQDGLLKALDKLTDIEEVFRVVG